MFDCHAHYDDRAFDADRDTLMHELFANGVSGIVNSGCDLESSRASLELAHRFDGVYASVGVHPCGAGSLREGWTDELEALMRDEKAVAIGEIGLDYYHEDYAPREKQMEVFDTQLSLAQKIGARVVIHDREAHADCISMTLAHKGLIGMFHCFSGSLETAKLLLDAGWYISVGGVLTYKNARVLPEVVAYVPFDRLLTETDCPYLTPVPNRGKRNRSDYITYVLQKIAEIKGVSFDEAERITEQNARDFYRLKA